MVVHGLAGAEGAVLCVVVSHGGANFTSVRTYVCTDGYKAQFLRYLDKNFMEGVFQYYLEVLFLVFEKKFKKSQYLKYGEFYEKS